MLWEHHRAPVNQALVGLCLALLLSACGAEQNQQLVATTVHSSQTSQHELSIVAERSFGGSKEDSIPHVLSKPRSAANLGDNVVILDSDWKRVFLFDSTGVLLDTIGDGYGMSPGQLALPVEMSVFEDLIHVVDYELRNATTWDADGGLVRVIDLTAVRPRGLAATSAGLQIRFMFPINGHWGGIIDTDGSVIEYIFPLAEGDAEFKDAGYGGTLAQASTAAGESVFVHPTGALARYYSPSKGEYRDLQLEPIPSLLAGPDGLHFAPVAPFGAVFLSDNRLLVLRSRRTRSPAEDSGAYELALYDDAGQLLGTHHLPEGSMPLALDKARGPNAFYVSYFLPQPEVIRYVLLEDPS